MRNIRFLTSFFLVCLFSLGVYAQPVPSELENIPYLVVFGPKCPTSWGDDDFSQTFFFLVPKEHTSPVYIRVYDPDVGGDHDEINGVWDTRTNFSVYGGFQAWSNEDAQGVSPTGNYRSGNLLASRTFGLEPEWDRKWYTFGPFNPTEGEFSEQFDGYIFKIIAEGMEGDDGNLYRYFLSTSPSENKPVEGANAFAYEYTFRMHDDPSQVSRVYPFLDNLVESVKISNFDWDSDGFIRIVSPGRKGQVIKVSGDDVWIDTTFAVNDFERNASFDVQMHKRKDIAVRNNNVVITVQNQYGELLPFFTIPIGGVPRYRYSIGVRQKVR